MRLPVREHSFPDKISHIRIEFRSRIGKKFVEIRHYFFRVRVQNSRRVFRFVQYLFESELVEYSILGYVRLLHYRGYPVSESRSVRHRYGVERLTHVVPRYLRSLYEFSYCGILVKKRGSRTYSPSFVKRVRWPCHSYRVSYGRFRSLVDVERRNRIRSYRTGIGFRNLYSEAFEEFCLRSGSG